MSLYKDASLAMIPSAYKDGKLYSIRPTDGSGDFTFSRGSNLAATRVDVNGLIEKGRENLLLYSNTFSSWTSIGSSLTSNQAGYDGSSDAWLIEKTADAGRVQINVDAGLATYSVYAKAGSVSWIRLLKGGNASAYFDLSNGTIGDLFLTIDATITSVGGGWYRCTMTYQDAFSGTIRIYPAIADSDTSGTSGNIYIQDAQVERSMAATDYIETGASTAQAGILEDMPRLDYSGGASCPSLLLEPQRSNLFPNSEYFGSWQVFRGSLTANSITSPEGVVNAYRYEENADTGQHFVRFQSISMTSGTDYTASVFVKAGEKTSVILGTNAPSIWSASATFNLSTGEVTSGSGTIEPMENDWYRCIISGECLTTSSSAGLEITTSSGAGSSGDGLYIYGAQMEVGSYPTSYIPTYGSSVTRSGDAMNEQISGLTSLEQGTFFLDFDRGLTTATSRDASNDGFHYSATSGFPSSTAIEVATEPDGRARLALRLSSFTSIYLDNTLSRYKMLVKWEGTSVKAYVNGVLKYSSAVKWADATAALEYIGYRGDFRKSVNQVLTFPTALTDSECIALTTL